MISSCDSGSLPFNGDVSKFLDGAKDFGNQTNDNSADYFKKIVIESFLDKIRVGLDLPNYPQFRDMSQMILDMMDGLEKLREGYIEASALNLKPNNTLPEIAVLEKNSKLIEEEAGKPFEVRVCITGPYTLASFFPYRNEEIFKRLGLVISQILEKSLFFNRYGKTVLVSIDEPLFGLMDDPLIDFGSDGRENLRKSWEAIFYTAKSKNIKTMIHLHSTANPLFWEISNLDIIDSHVNDPLIQMKKTRELLESEDKFLKASLAINDFDLLIKKKIVSSSKEKIIESEINQEIANTWSFIQKGKIDPIQFLETSKIMEKRLFEIIGRFGPERVQYSGPECGLKGYPTYETALECLRRISTTTKNLKK
ncbi:MAG: hypothetical protein P8X97_00435 [Candidatus Bathyarchaeota archaeon]